MDNNTKKGFMCLIDWSWELGEALGGTKVYPSLDDLKENHQSWETCGIIEVEISKIKTIVKAKPYENN